MSKFLHSRRSIVALALGLAAFAAVVPLTYGFGGGARGPAPAWIPQGYNDHQNMMDQLGIKTLRPGKSGSNQTGKGFDEATANDWMPTMPDPLTFKDGTKVTSADQWPKRRAEILEDFEREVYGRIPQNVPKVTWEVSDPTPGTMAGVATLTRTLTGHVDNSAFPQITVNIRASFTVPANATDAVPVFLEFGGVGGGGFGGGGGRGGAGRGPAGAPAAPAAPAPGGAMGPDGQSSFYFVAAPAGGGAGAGGGRAGGFGGGAGGGFGGGAAAGGAGGRGPGGFGGGASYQQLAIQHGWGYGSIDPGSVQADGGGNALRQGIIGLTNKGEPRKPDDWGALRAWQWGVSQVINCLEAHPEYKADPKKVAIEGVSRYGKAAIVTEAFEPRVAVALVASSGEGGVKLHRHDFGEAVENLTADEYYWMAGNFLKYGAKEFTDPAKPEMNASNLPVDSHELIALCAPRPCFISQGVESAGDPKWIDAAGSMRAAILASPVYELLGKKGLNTDLARDMKWVHAELPAVGTLLGGDLAFRQHNGGHTAGPNFGPFFDWVAAYVPSPYKVAAAPAN